MWDDDLLPYSIASIRDHVDIIIVVVSYMSNIGEPYVPDLRFLEGQRDVVIVRYDPNLNISAQANEEAKRNLGLMMARTHRCTHIFSTDCDELFRPYDFADIKKEVIEGNYDASACKLLTFYKHPTIQVDPPENYYVPAIHKIHPQTKFCFDKGYPVFADPTRRTNTYKKFLKIEEHLMHHYSFVRKDIERKWRNSSSAHAFQNIPQMKKDFDAFEQTGKMVFFKDFGWKEVPNYFNIQI